MFFTKKKSLRFLLLAVSGLLTGFTLIFPEIGFLEWLTLIPAALFLLEYASNSNVRFRRLYGYGIFFFMIYYLMVYHWFVNLYPLEFIDGMTKGTAIAVVLVAWIGLSLLQALMGGLVFVFAGVVFRTRFAKRIPFLRPFLAAGLWGALECSQTIGWWGVPWGRLPIGQSEYIVGLQTASLFGPYFITFLLVAVNFCFAYAIIAIATKKSEDVSKFSLVKSSCIAIAAMLIFQYGAGAVLYFVGHNTGDTVTVASVQGNISSHEKWNSESTKRTQEIYTKYTLEAAAQGADIVVWPETALPYVITEKNIMGRFVSKLAQKANVTILVGAFTLSEEDEGDYNSIAVFLPDGSMHETVYSKRKLVPFGEFVPLRGIIETLIPPLAELVMSGEDVAWGEDTSVFKLEEANIGSLICFDSIYEDLTRQSVSDGAELICLSTNDSWFTDSAALYMHNAQAQLRAIESGRYIVRSANTGISTVITDRGEVIAELEPLVEGMIVEEVYTRDNITLYTRIGNVFVYLSIFALAYIMSDDIIYRIRKRKNKMN